MLIRIGTAFIPNFWLNFRPILSRQSARISIAYNTVAVGYSHGIPDLYSYHVSCDVGQVRGHAPSDHRSAHDFDWYLDMSSGQWLNAAMNVSYSDEIADPQYKRRVYTRTTARAYAHIYLA